MKKKNSVTFGSRLHRVCAYGWIEKVKEYLDEGDNPKELDSKERTPLHFACGFGNEQTAIAIVNLLLNARCFKDDDEDGSAVSEYIDCIDVNGNGALHIAANVGHREVVRLLLGESCDMGAKNKAGVAALEIIFKKVPSVIISEYDKSVVTLAGMADDANQTLGISFGYLIGYPDDDEEMPHFRPETQLLKLCLRGQKHTRDAILSHVIVQLFLYLKWRKIRVLIWISMIYHVIWLVMYTATVWELYIRLCPSSMLSKTCTTEGTTTYLTTLASVVAGLTILTGLKEAYEIYSSPSLKQYLKQYENIGQLVMLPIILATLEPCLNIQNVCVKSWQNQTSAFGVLIAWGLILGQLGNLPMFGVQVEILVKVLRSFVKFITTFSTVLIGFGIAFKILLPMNKEFQEIPWAFLQIYAMMTGEVNYKGMFFEEPVTSDIPYVTTTQLIYAMFMAVVTTMLFNLLLGLTISDIQKLQQHAKLNSLAKQLDQITLMEKIVFSEKLQTFLKIFGKQHWIRNFSVTYQYDEEDDCVDLDIEVVLSDLPYDLRDGIQKLTRPVDFHESDDESEVTNTDNKSDGGESSQSSGRPSVAISISDDNSCRNCFNI